MAFDRMTDDLDIISKYPDEPYEEDGFTSEAFKASFDQGAKLCKAAINRLVDKLNGKSTGAKYLGFLRSDRVPADNVQDAIDNVQQQIADAYSESAIPDGAVTSAKIDDGAVTTGKIDYSAVTTGKIAPGAVTYDKIAEDAVTSFAIADEAVTTAKIDDGAVTSGKIMDAAVTSDKISYGAVTGEKISDTGWVPVANLETDFRRFSSSSQPVEYRKIGDVVFLHGAVQPTKTLVPLNGSSEILYPIFTLPAGFRPKSDSPCSFVCPGSGTAKWLLHVQPNGTANFSRYTNENGFINAGTSAWLAFDVSFPVY